MASTNEPGEASGPSRSEEPAEGRRLAPRWLAAPIPADEAERLEELRALRILDTAAEERFDRITRLVADVFGVPIALVSLVDEHRQWFKSRVGIDATETPRDLAFCSHAVMDDDGLVVSDASRDDRFADNPLVTGELGVRFYAGAVLHGPRGKRVGSLCLVDRVPRDLTGAERQRLNGFARIVEAELAAWAEIDALKARVLETAFIDPESGLPNRRLALDRLRNAMAHAQAHGESVVVLDIHPNELATAREALGAAAVADIVREIARRLLDETGPGPTVARWGDDFVIVASSRRDEAAGLALAQAEAILDALERPVPSPRGNLHLTASVGIALYPDHGDTAETLRSRAASARLSAGVGDRSSFTMYESAISERFRHQFELVSQLRGAWQRGELQLVYQPQVAVGTGRIVGAEALVRWTHPRLGVLGADEFIQVAESCGVVEDIGAWGLGVALEAARRWNEGLATPVPVAVNISPRHFRRPQLRRSLEQLFAEHPGSARLLTVEITEGVLADDPDAVAAVMGELAGLGVRMALDDFGTGYSSLNYLLRMPVHEVKIDKSFVAGLDSDPRREAIVRAVVTMCHALGKHVVAEGVETSGQLETLRSLGVDIGQGFHFGQGLPAAELTALIAAGARLPAG